MHVRQRALSSFILDENLIERRFDVLDDEASELFWNYHGTTRAGVVHYMYSNYR